MHTPLPELSALRVIVVDDRPQICEVMRKLLAGCGVRSVESANDGARALRIIEGSEPRLDVAIFDIDMPTDDGLVCLRKLAGTPTPPAVILMSGKDPLVLDAARLLGEGLGLRILAALQKPVTGTTLRTVLMTIHGRSAVAVRKTSVRLDAQELRTALDKKRLELWFQPQYHITSRKFHGAEVLLRLRDPQLGLVGPDAFIKTAEDSGLIDRLTEFVLTEAISRCRAWRSAGWYLTVAVNLSKAGLEDLSLPDRAAAICETQGIPTKQLGFELTESSVAANPTALLDITTRLRLKGFRLSLDDFGTGYASLEELRSLPFHELKLDKQFVQTAHREPRSRAILESSIRLASELGMTVVAEGVETEEMLDMVAALGCQIAQGYLLGEPMPADDFLEWLNRRTPAGHAAVGRPLRAVQPVSTAAPDSPAARPAIRETVLKFAHDAASPLMMVMGLSEEMLDDVSATPEQRKDLIQIREAAEQLSAMLKTLQQRARETEDSGQQMSSPSTINTSSTR